MRFLNRFHCLQILFDETDIKLINMKVRNCSAVRQVKSCMAPLQKNFVEREPTAHYDCRQFRPLENHHKRTMNGTIWINKTSVT